MVVWSCGSSPPEYLIDLFHKIDVILFNLPHIILIIIDVLITVVEYE